LKSPADFKEKSQEKLLQLQMTQAFLTQNQQMRNLLNQSATALTAFQKNYDKDKKKIEKLKKQVKEGKREKEKTSKSASLGGSNSQPLSLKEEDGEKKEHKSKHRRQKSMDSHSRRVASRNLSTTSKSSSKKDLTELVNGSKTTST